MPPSQSPHLLSQLQSYLPHDNQEQFVSQFEQIKTQFQDTILKNISGLETLTQDQYKGVLTSDTPHQSSLFSQEQRQFIELFSPELQPLVQARLADLLVTKTKTQTCFFQSRSPRSLTNNDLVGDDFPNKINQKIPKDLTTLHLFENPFLTLDQPSIDTLAKDLSHLKNIRILPSAHFRDWSNILKFFEQLPNIETLTINIDAPSQNDLDHVVSIVKALPQLHQLTLNYQLIANWDQAYTQQFFRALCNLKELNVLFDSGYITDSSLMHIAPHLTQITSLGLSFIKNIDHLDPNNLGKFFQHLTSLKHLSISNPQVLGVSFEHLYRIFSPLTQLQSLHIPHLNFDTTPPQDLKAIFSPLQDLKYLHIPSSICTELSPSFLAFSQILSKNLLGLNLEHFDGSPEVPVLQTLLSSQPQLRHLNLDSCNLCALLSPKELKELFNTTPHLESLSLFNQDLQLHDDTYLDAFRLPVSLKHLNLSQTSLAHLSAYSLAQLGSRLSSLKTLDVSGSNNVLEKYLVKAFYSHLSHLSEIHAPTPQITTILRDVPHIHDALIS